MTRTYERVAIAIFAVSALCLAAGVVKKEFFPSSGADVSLGIVCCNDSSWWNPRYAIGIVPRWTFGGAHSYTTRELMGQRI